MTLQRETSVPRGTFQTAWPFARNRPAFGSTSRTTDLIEEVIDSRSVSTVFQPIVELASRTIVGFEALSRGPAGTVLESPQALFAAARQVGRFGELDWICRINALQLAAASGLHPDLTWFVNVEPASVAIRCPSDLQPALRRSLRSLRVMLEVVERDVDADIPALLRGTDWARAQGCGVALDDVGAQEKSLALLPFLQPDVVKLDLSLLQHRQDASSAVITGAVRAYAERTGACILAEGIETEAHLSRARVFGAAYGQGFMFGRPGPLPASIPAPATKVGLRSRSESTGAPTPFELLSARMPTVVARKRDLLHISAHLETQQDRHDGPCVLLGGFQRRHFFTDRKQSLYRRLSKNNALTVVVADGVDSVHESRYRVVTADPRDPMCSEWQVIAVSPHFAGAFVARDLGDSGPDLDRRFEFVFTHDRESVVAAGRAFLSRVESNSPALQRIQPRSA